MVDRVLTHMFISSFLSTKRHKKDGLFVFYILTAFIAGRLKLL